MTQEHQRGRIPGRIAWLIAASMALLSCNKQAPAPESQPPPVTTAKPTQKQIIEWDFYTGRTEAVESVNITPRVSGYINNITFRAGDLVNKGDLLFVIDPRPYQATLDQAKAQQLEAEANQQLQDANFARQDRLRQTGVIAKEDFDTALSNKNQARARVLAAQASVESAQLNLTFTQVTSPIRGLLSRELVTVGNLVQADTTLLTNIVSVDPIYAYFNVDERSVLKYEQQVRQGKLANARSGGVPISLQLGNENGFPHQGSIDFINNQFNSSTGTLQVRGLFPNADEVLISGSFVRVRVAGTPLHPALLVSDRAIGTDQGQKFVLVVGKENIVEVKPVELGPEAEGLRVVRSGLTGDEEVIINGIVNARPGSKVSPKEGDMSQFATNQLQLQTNRRVEPVGDEKEKAGGNQSPHPQGQAPGKDGQTNPPKSGGSR
jgi:multidrug efflux system membrane fusion protein